MTNGVVTMNNPSRDEQREMNPILRGIASFALTMVLVFLIGFLHGHIDHGVDHGHPRSVGYVLRFLIPLAGIVACGWGLFRLLRPMFQRKINNAPMWKTRMGRINLMWAIIMPLSDITGVALSATGIDIFDPTSFEANVTPVIAIAAAVAAIILLIAFDKFYRRNVDEMELNAVFEASYWGINFYTVAMPVGWLLWKAKLVNEMPSWPIFWTAMFIYGSLFLWKKYR